MMKILLFRGRGLSSALIRWQTWSKHSHAAVVLDDGTMIESYPGTGVVRHSKYEVSRILLDGLCDKGRGKFISFEPVINFAQKEAIIGFLRAQCGKPYDWKGVFRFVLPFLRRNPKEAPSAQSRWFCSDLIAAAFESAGRPLLYRIPFFKVSPEKLSYSPILQEDYDPDFDRDFD